MFKKSLSYYAKKLNHYPLVNYKEYNAGYTCDIIGPNDKNVAIVSKGDQVIVTGAMCTIVALSKIVKGEIGCTNCTPITDAVAVVVKILLTFQEFEAQRATHTWYEVVCDNGDFIIAGIEQRFSIREKGRFIRQKRNEGIYITYWHG